MYRVMVPIHDPASGRFLHHIRQGRAIMALETARRRADRAQRNNNSDVPVMLLDDENRVPYVAGEDKWLA